MIKNRVHFIITLITVVWSSQIYGQRYHFKKYSNEEGLSQSQVQAVLEDTYGHLWVATNGGGVNRFDGMQFTVFTNKEGLQHNHITKMYEDPDHRIWFLTEYAAGVAVFDGSRFTIINNKLGLPGNMAYDIVCDTLGRIWLATPGGICQADPQMGINEPMTTRNGLHRDTITNLFKDSRGWIWGYNPKRPGATQFNMNSFQPLITNGKLFSDTILDIAEDHDHALWVRTPNGIQRIFIDEGSNDHRMKVMIGKAELKDTRLRSLISDKDDNIWILTDKNLLHWVDGQIARVENNMLPEAVPDNMITDNNGSVALIYNRIGNAIYHKEKWTLYPTDNSFIDNPVNCFLKDTQGTLWLGTNGAGIIKYPSLAFNYYDNENGMSSKIVFGIEEDKMGRMWFGTLGRGITVYDGLHFSYYNKSNGFPSNSVWSITRDQDGILWFGTSDGLVRYDGKNFRTFTTKDGLLSNTVFVVKTDSQNRLWIAYSENGFSVYDRKSFRHYTEADGVERVAMSFTENRDSSIWVATDGQGLLHLTKKGIKILNAQQGLSSDYLMWVTHDSEDNLWIATQDNGIVKYDGHDFLRINTTNGLSHNAVMSLMFDRDGNLWAGTNMGLNKISFNDFGNVKNIRHYQKLDGFVGIECNSGAIMQDSRGKIWIGSSVLVRYDPELDIQNSIPPKTHITKVKLFFKDLDLSIYADSMRPLYNVPYSITLPYDQNHLTIEFIGISLKVPEKIIYYYKMEGLDKDWSPYDSKTEARYSSIPPGNYTFMVLARNEDKVWNDMPVTMQITILPPPWQTWYFYVLCAIIFALIAYALVRWRVRSFKRAQQHLEEKVTERTETITRQKNELEFAYNEIRDSIKYARRIQESILPPKDVVKSLLPDAFVLYRPKDIVSGDFYWIDQKGDVVMIAAVDCTGHGVPGAFMSIMGHSKLNQVVSHLGDKVDAAEILNNLNTEVSNSLKKSSLEESAKDGMDITFCAINLQTRELQFAGAYNPLYLIRDGIFREVKGDKFPIGIFLGKQTLPFTNHTLKLQENDVFYLFSDGYVDQFGGPRNKKFMSARFKSLLMDIYHLPMEEQSTILEENLDEWRNGSEQVDDILVMGVRV
ncbi:MAG: SpoIIE family protein phosphatase [Flavobacteriales bacterium]|nr:SpoIIE family protein phosphatase [Flavobacteriales bacterium]